MKTTLDELIEHFIESWSSPSDLWKPGEVIKKLEKMKEREKEIMVFFAWNWAHEKATHKEIEEDFDETFNVSEK